MVAGFEQRLVKILHKK